jgi:orotate phosphoribosyltransferase
MDKHPSVVLRDRLRACVREGDFVLSSGKHSRYFVDVMWAMSDRVAYREQCAATRATADRLGAQCLAGIATGGVPIAYGAALDHGGEMSMLTVRPVGRPASGQPNLEILGELPAPGTRVVIVEDVVTTGRTVIATDRRLKLLGLDVVGITAVVNRGFGHSLVHTHYYLEDLLPNQQGGSE